MSDTSRKKLNLLGVMYARLPPTCLAELRHGLHASSHLAFADMHAARRRGEEPEVLAAEGLVYARLAKFVEHLDEFFDQLAGEGGRVGACADRLDPDAEDSDA